MADLSWGGRTTVLAWWDDGEVLDPARAGPKAASLAAMARGGLAVPAGFVVLADAPRDPDGRATAALTDAITAAYLALGRPPVAVRSSATAEDLEGASFAGQYDTVLGVEGEAALHEAVGTVWRSLGSERAVAYRRERGIAEEGLGMAVVVQAMVPADAAGVLFTRHPLTGDDGAVMVSAAAGLGQGVVDGTAAVDTYTLDAATGATRSVELAGPAPVLDDDALAALVKLAGDVRSIFDGHRDVEFAFHDGDVFALQARPITALAEADGFPVEWDDPADGARSWTLRSGEPVLTLELDIQAAMFERMAAGFAEVGSPMMQLHVWREVNGYVYARRTDADPDEVSARQADLRASHERYAAAGTSVFEVEVEPVLVERLAALRRLRARRSLAGRVALVEQAIAVYADAMGNQHWRIQSQPVDWPARYAELTGRPADEATILLQGLDNRTTRLIRDLRRLARLVQQDPALAAAFEARDWAELDALLGGPSPAPAGSPRARFAAGFRRLLRAHGLRTGMGMGGTATFTSPTWNMAPSIPLGMIASYVRQDLDGLDRRQRGLRRQRQRLERAIRAGLGDDPDRLASFELARRRMVNDARTTEDHNHLMEQAAGGSMREAVLLAGQRLVADGRLDDPDDVFHLSLDELRSLAAGRDAIDVAGLVRARVARRRHQRGLRPPRTLGPPDDAAGGGGMAWMAAAPEGSGLDGDVLRGIAASRGRATGPVRVSPPEHAPPDVRPGDILVARLVGEAWTPIFPLLGGLVLDFGGIFQHAAVVAREYGIPAVMMTREATKVLRDGQVVTVDGDLGVVLLG
ncbi:MAG: PEP/pyruvate-binding domain-containing protein [Acidimicrobiia bacterium]